jgi:hypothetical protein
MDHSDYERDGCDPSLDRRSTRVAIKQNNVSNRSVRQRRSRGTFCLCHNLPHLTSGDT